MDPEQFCYWLKGITESKVLPTKEQWETIVKNLNDVLSNINKSPSNSFTPFYYPPLRTVESVNVPDQYTWKVTCDNDQSIIPNKFNVTYKNNSSVTDLFTNKTDKE